MDFSDRFIELKEKTENLDNYTLNELKDLLNKAKEVHSIYKNFQLVAKCNANSLYGVQASIYFSLCDFDVAEDITMSAKHATCIVDVAINKFFVNWGDVELNIIREFYPQVKKIRKFTEYVPDTVNDLCVYGDTDSRYIDLEKIYSFLIIEEKDGREVSMKLPESDKELSDFALFIVNKFFVNIIKKTIDDDCEIRNARKGYLKMNHEVTSRKTIFRAKKQYIMPAIWEDGKFYETPKLKYKGVELKKGSMSQRAKQILTKLVEKFIIDNFSTEQLRQECLKIIKYIKIRKDKDFLYLISSVSGLKNIEKNSNGTYVSDKNHIQMQIVLSWLNFIEQNQLHNLYKPPFEGQKMNYYYCDQNSGYKVIGIPDDVDIKEIKNLPEPDWNRMINATLLKPLLRYINEKQKIDDVDIEHFILGIKQWNF